MMLRLFLLCAALAAATPATAATPIFGRWITHDGDAIVRVEACGAKLCGQIERVLDPRAPKNDINNHDRGRRGKPLVGTMVLSDFAASGAVWKGGTAYDPKSGKDYRGELQLLTGDKLKVTGCVLVICRSMYWTRVN